jgi:hypothetical protein
MGQPVLDWQNGTPQSMHRAACRTLIAGSSGVATSAQSFRRDEAGRYFALLRSYFMKPRILSMCSSPTSLFDGWDAAGWALSARVANTRDGSAGPPHSWKTARAACREGTPDTTRNIRA